MSISTNNPNSILKLRNYITDIYNDTTMAINDVMNISDCFITAGADNPFIFQKCKETFSDLDVEFPVSQPIKTNNNRIKAVDEDEQQFLKRLQNVLATETKNINLNFNGNLKIGKSSNNKSKVSTESFEKIIEDVRTAA